MILFAKLPVFIRLHLIVSKISNKNVFIDWYIKSIPKIEWLIQAF